MTGGEREREKEKEKERQGGKLGQRCSEAER